MTATRLQVSSISSDSTLSGRLVSTTTSSAPGWHFRNASPPEIITPAYSGCSAILRIRGWAALFSVSMTIWHFLPRLRAMQHTPMAAPTESMSAYLWPMTYTCLASSISSPSALAMTRDFTFVRFSVDLLRPP